ncbi:baculoviral IAP repeat-containing protein 7 [Trichechus inunguis]
MSGPLEGTRPHLSERDLSGLRHRVTLAATLAPSRRRQRALAALPAPWALPHLGPLVGRAPLPALLSQLLGTEAGAVPRSPSAGWLDVLEDWGTSAFSMGPEDSGGCCCCGLGLSPTQGHHTPHPRHSHGQGWDSVDGQILGQLRPLADEEEEEEEEEEVAEATWPLGPAFPGMGSEELRLASFHDWLASSVRPAQLAEAGFFYTGPQDKVRCFFCCGGLQSWERGDDPWTEHAKWFPRCEFLLQSKGRGFVRSVQDSYSPLLRSWMFSGSFQDPLEEPGHATPTGWVEGEGRGRQLGQRGGGSVQTWDGQCAPHPAPPPPPGAESTEEQLRRLRRERTCKVCLDREVGVVFVPCGHLVCTECAPNLRLCPICRAPIRSCVRTFLS